MSLTILQSFKAVTSDHCEATVEWHLWIAQYIMLAAYPLPFDLSLRASLGVSFGLLCVYSLVRDVQLVGPYVHATADMWRKLLKACRERRDVVKKLEKTREQ